MSNYRNPQKSPWLITMKSDGSQLTVDIEAHLTQNLIKDLLGHIEWVLEEQFVEEE